MKKRYESIKEFVLKGTTVFPGTVFEEDTSLGERWYVSDEVIYSLELPGPRSILLTTQCVEENPGYFEELPQ